MTIYFGGEVSEDEIERRVPELEFCGCNLMGFEAEQNGERRRCLPINEAKVFLLFKRRSLGEAPMTARLSFVYCTHASYEDGENNERVELDVYDKCIT